LDRNHAVVPLNNNRRATRATSEQRDEREHGHGRQCPELHHADQWRRERRRQVVDEPEGVDLGNAGVGTMRQPRTRENHGRGKHQAHDIARMPRVARAPPSIAQAKILA
jgi:hypothetical protein